LEFSSLLLNDERVIRTFFDAYTHLKEARKEKKITDGEFFEGLLEVLGALSIFTNHDKAFTKEEKRVQSAVLGGFLEAVFSATGRKKELRPLKERYETIKRRHFIGFYDDDRLWKELLSLTTEVAEKLKELKPSGCRLRLLIPLLVSLMKFYYWSLLQKRERVEDLL